MDKPADESSKPKKAGSRSAGVRRTEPVVGVDKTDHAANQREEPMRKLKENPDIERLLESPEAKALVVPQDGKTVLGWLCGTS